MPPPPLSPSILVAVLAPAYHAARVLQHPNPPPGEVRRWARYLLILALVSLAESLVLDRAFFWVPLYAELKTAALAWAAWVPGGADVAFETVVAPALAEHGPAVDAAAATARAAVAAAVAARAGDALRAARGAAGGGGGGPAWRDRTRAGRGGALSPLLSFIPWFCLRVTAAHLSPSLCTAYARRRDGDERSQQNRATGKNASP